MSSARTALLLLAATGLSVSARPASAEHTPGAPGWQQDVHYSLTVTYTPAKYEIAGQETLAYWNLSPDTLSELYFHVYLNAYRPGSHMARYDASQENWRIQDLPRKRWGSERIEGARILRGDTLKVETDDTIARVGLPQALAPGESVIVCLDFRSVIPDVPERMGRTGKGIFAAQWYPRVCVYDRFGWHTEQHLGSEFYGDFGAFDVRITLPGNFLVAHTGTLVNPAEVLPDSILARLREPGDAAVTIWDRSGFSLPADSSARRAMTMPRTWVIHADSVHDFAWACEDKWIWRRARWNGIEVHTYHRSADAKRWMDMASEGARMMEFMNRKFGPYPYPRFSFVEEPIGAGGVEFPNIVWITPRRATTGVSRRLEYLFAHELAHNWFYGMVGNNETAQAFLDEGLTSYAETAIMEALYGRLGNLTQLRKPRWLHPQDDSRSTAWRNYLEFQASGIEEPVVTHSDFFKNPAAYYPSVYHKSNVGLWTLRSIAGEERFDAAMREYFATWRFHHPYAEDFFASMNHALGASYDWFWRGWFLRTDAIDVKLEHLRFSADSSSAELWLRSRGGIDPPVPVRFRDNHGHAVTRVVPREAFLSAAGSAVTRFRLPFVPSRVELDPDFTLPDLDWSDNRNGGWPRFQTMVDNWRSSPKPIGKTLLLWRPDLWYHSEAGPQAGIAFDASTVRWEHALQGLAGMNTREPRAFGDLEARARSLAADPRRIFRARGYDLDGHRGFRLSVNQELGSRIERGFRSTLGAGVDLDRLYDREMPRRPVEWSSGGHPNLEATLSSKRKFHRVQWSGSLRLRTDLLTESASYGSIFGTTTAEVTVIPKLPLWLRAAAGRVRGSAIPTEERFYLAGAGPRGEWASRWFRSRGTIPTHWNAALGGDGNVRAFADDRPSGATLVAVNAESRASRLLPSWIPFLGKLRVPILDPRSSLFADAGQVTDGDVAVRDFSADLGVGVRTKPLFRNHLVLRADLPVWRSPAEAGEKPWKLRAVVSVGEAF